MVKPRVIMIAFGWEDYPKEILLSKINESYDCVRSLDIELVKAGPVLKNEDIQGARSMLKKEEYDFIIILIASWLDDINVIAVLEGYYNVPILLWGHQPFKHNDETITLGAMVGASILRETFEEMDINHKFIFGMPSEEGIKSQIRSFALASYAWKKLSFSRMGLFGYAAMGIYTATFDHVSLRKKVGPEIIHFDQYALIEGIKKVPREDFNILKKQIIEKFNLKIKNFEEDADIISRMYLSLLKLIDDNSLDALTIKCHHELSKNFGTTPCMPLSILGDKVISSCEGDVLLLVTQYLLHLISGKQTSFGDIQEVREDRISITTCGFAPFSMCNKDKLSISSYAFAGWKGLLNSTPYLEDRKITLARIASKGDNYKLHYLTGTTKVMGPFREAGCPDFPRAEILPDSDGVEFGKKICSNHYAIVFEDTGSILDDFCLISGIKKISSI